jgi:hypothetical protein
MEITEHSCCWVVEGPSGNLLTILVGKMSEVLPAARMIEGFYVEGRSGRTYRVGVPELRLYVRQRRQLRSAGWVA